MTSPINARLPALQRRVRAYAYTDTALYIPTLEYEETTELPSTRFECAVVDGSLDGGENEIWKNVNDFDLTIYFDALTPLKGASIKVLNRLGKAIDNKTYEIVGIQNRGSFGYVCALKAITTG